MKVTNPERPAKPSPVLKPGERPVDVTAQRFKAMAVNRKKPPETDNND
jgi:hypothetical protein